MNLQFKTFFEIWHALIKANNRWETPTNCVPCDMHRVWNPMLTEILQEHGVNITSFVNASNDQLIVSDKEIVLKDSSSCIDVDTVLQIIANQLSKSDVHHRNQFDADGL